MADNWHHTGSREDTIRGFVSATQKRNVEVLRNILQKKRSLLARIRGI